MENVLINKELYITLSDGLHQMTPEEYKQNNMAADGSSVSFLDPARQIIVSIGWKKTALGSMMMDADDVAKNLEANMSRSLRGAGYQKSNIIQRNLGGLEAMGFDFTYQAQGENIIGYSYVVEKGKTFYYFNFYGRSGTKEEYDRIWNEMLNSIKWG